MAAPVTNVIPTSSNQKKFLYFLVFILVLCLGIGPLISFLALNDCKEQNDCEGHVNYLYHLGWIARIPRALGIDWDWLPSTPCIKIDATITCDDPSNPSNGCPIPSTVSPKDSAALATADYLVCTDPKENFYVDSRGFSVPLTDCSSINKYTKTPAADGKNNECEDCPTITNLKTGINTTCDPIDSTPAGDPGPVVIKSGEPRPSSGSYCDDGYKVVRTSGESDKCEACGDIENSTTGSTICKDPIESELSTGSTIHKFKSGSQYGCNTTGTTKYTRLSGSDTESDSCVDCTIVNLDSTNHRNARTTAPLFSTLTGLSDGYTIDNQSLYFEVSGSGLPIDINSKAFTNCSDGNPCDNLLCTGTDKEGNNWISHYMDVDSADPSKFICKPCGMVGLKTGFTSGRSTDGTPSALIVGTEEQCRSGVGTVFYDEGFHFADADTAAAATGCKTQGTNWDTSGDTAPAPIELATLPDDATVGDYCQTSVTSFTDVTKIVGPETYLLHKCS